MSIRVLFVDDEENVLFALRRAMHAMRDEWRMEFVVSGAAALESLAREPADVVVSDMRMPGMDGWQLLGRVKDLYPETVRLVLSGHAEPGAIMRLVGAAHQYIAKPGDSDTLKAAIVQTQLMKSLLSSRSLALKVGQVGSLPSFPQAFQEITEALRRPNSTAADAARIIARDVAMTANVMKMVNSAFFGARRSITSVERAVAYLGLDTLTALVLGHGLFKSGDAPGLEAIWQHSLHTAIAARAIALQEQWPVTQVDEAFLAGLLHDVGRVVLATPDPEQSAESDVAHAEAGAYLLGLWGFPSHIVAAVALHHMPGHRADPGLDLTAIVHIADRLARDEVPGIEAGLLERLNLQNHVPGWLQAVRQGRSEDQAV